MVMSSLDLLNHSTAQLCNSMSEYSSANDQYVLSREAAPYRQAMNEAVVGGTTVSIRDKVEEALHLKVLFFITTEHTVSRYGGK